MSFLKSIFYLNVCLNIIQIAYGQINWQGLWALNCDFYDNDLSSAKVPGAECSNKCVQTSGCTHFSWNSYEGGTCWMKKGLVSKSDAFYKANTVCGLVSTPGPLPSNGFRKMVNF